MNNNEDLLFEDNRTEEDIIREVAEEEGLTYEEVKEAVDSMREKGALNFKLQKKQRSKKKVDKEKNKSKRKQAKKSRKKNR